MSGVEAEKSFKKDIKSEKSEKSDNGDDIDDTLQNYYAEWSSQHERILVEWADKAICYRWLHSSAQINYLLNISSNIHYLFNIS